MQTYVAESDGEAGKTAEVHAMWYHELFRKVLPGAPGKKFHEGYEIHDVVRKKHAEAVTVFFGKYGRPIFVTWRSDGLRGFNDD